jgi:hypothetical protein
MPGFDFFGQFRPVSVRLGQVSSCYVRLGQVNIC